MAVGAQFVLKTEGLSAETGWRRGARVRLPLFLPLRKAKNENAIAQVIGPPNVPPNCWSEKGNTASQRLRRITRIERIVSEISIEGAVVVIGARLGLHVDLNPRGAPERRIRSG